jgi:hypothetical protein
VKHYATGNMQALQETATGAGAIWLTVVSSRPGAGHGSVKGARSYVREALDAVAAWRPVPVASTRPYGCSVKYRHRCSREARFAARPRSGSCPQRVP